MSCKRASTLVETLNATVAQPLIESRRGGAGSGGASLTAQGEQALAHYRRLQAKAAQAAAGEVAALQRMRRDDAAPK